MNVFVDTSVWIDLFGDRDTLETRMLRDITARAGKLLIGDLVLTEVLQGTRDHHDFARKLVRLSLFDHVTVVSKQSRSKQRETFKRSARSASRSARRSIP